MSSCRFVRIRRNRTSSWRRGTVVSASLAALIEEHPRTSCSPSTARTSALTLSTILAAARAYFRANSLWAGGGGCFASSGAPSAPSVCCSASASSSRPALFSTAVGRVGVCAKRGPADRRMIPFGRDKINTPLTSGGGKTCELPACLYHRESSLYGVRTLVADESGECCFNFGRSGADGGGACAGRLYGAGCE